MQEDLFHPRETQHGPEPKGLHLYYDFISARDETNLLEKLKHLHWKQVEMFGVVAKRKVVHYGMDYHYDARAVRPTTDAPDFLNPFVEKVAKILKAEADDVAEILITQYPKGSGIGWHRDAAVFGDAVAGISLLSGCVMKFRKKTGTGFNTVPIALPPRSLYIISGEARWIWEHSITRHPQPRYSITFRTLKS
jgi:alkylated DNA repair protein (DNA oxidative demethylase)